ncbi:MAG: hypothetical protein JWN04_4579 [Myxococcaceae bacterium]|nr:hypothetical protein [Myxococcaceae bacterium]
MEVTLCLAARRLSRGLLVVSLGLLVALASAGARADDSANQEARTTFERGVVASRASQWGEARMQFERSLALVPMPSTMFNLALAYLKLGLGREALAQLDAFERAATVEEHSAMLARAQVLRPQAQALVDSAEAKAQSGGNVLSRSEDGLSDEARRDVIAARENYARGRDKQALEGFERAYRRSQRPELLYNIGVVSDRLRNDRRAISAYDAFVEALPDAREAAVAQVRSEALRVALERERSDPARTSSAQPRAPAAVDLRGPRTLLLTGSVLTTASVVALAVLTHKLSGYRECLDSVKGTASSHVCDNAHDVRKDKPAVVGGVATSAIVAAVGVVLTTFGAAQLYRRKHEQREAKFALLPSVSLGLEQRASVTLGMRF